MDTRRIPRRATARGNLKRLCVAIACLLPGGAMAGTYAANDEATLRAAIAQANVDGDPASTITLAADITLAPGAAPLPAPTKPVTLDTGAFILASSPVGAANSLVQFDGNVSELVVRGTVVGGPGTTGSFSAGAAGLRVNNVVASVVNQGTIIGGAGGPAGGSGGVAETSGAGTFVNEGLLRGGLGVLTGAGGTGANLNSTGTLTNRQRIEGGASQAGAGGVGVFMAAGGGTLVNEGTIAGGESQGGGAGGPGVSISGAGTFVVQNAGTIVGGTGAAAVSGAVAYTLVNSGTIQAGSGQADAVRETSPVRALTLELRAGSTIVGNVVASAGVNDVFRLGGDGDASFDTSAIGATAQYQRFDRFEKTGASTWTLSGNTVATTPWNLQQGTLRVGADASLGNPSSTLTFAGGALSTSADVTIGRAIALNGAGTFAPDAGTTLTLAGAVTGAGALTKTGGGTLVIPDAKSFTGGTVVDAGTLALDGSIVGPTTVHAAGTLAGTGTMHGDVANAGTIAPGHSIGTFTVDGNYVGQGGTLALEAALDGDASPADRLVVTGDTSGITNVRVTNVGGSGAPTVEGVRLVEVRGASDGGFNLVGDYVFQGQQAVVSGAYAYRLYKNGVANPGDGDWYLRSSVIAPADTTPPPTAPAAPPLDPVDPPAPLYAPGVPVYEAYAAVLQRLAEPGTLQQRVGARAAASADGHDDAAWVRVEGGHADLDPDRSTTRSRYDATTHRAQVGMDFLTRETGAGRLVAAVTAQYGRIASNVSSPYGLGEITAKSYGIGGTLTWYGSNGFYADAQARYDWYDSDLRSRTLGRSLVDGNEGSGYGLGVETGWKIAIGDGLSIVPQLQVTYASVRFDIFDDPYGARVSHEDGDRLVTRAGLAIDHDSLWTNRDGETNHAHVYAIANAYYDFLAGAKTDVSQVRLSSEEGSLWGGVGLGGSLEWKNQRYRVFGEASAQASLQHHGDGESYGLRLGFSMRW